MVLSCLLSDILQVLFTPSPFNPDFGGVPVVPDRQRWDSDEEQDPRLISREIIFEVFKPV